MASVQTRLSRRQKKSLLVKAGFLNGLGEINLSHWVADSIKLFGKLAHRFRRAKYKLVHTNPVIVTIGAGFGSLEIMPVFLGLRKKLHRSPAEIFSSVAEIFRLGSRLEHPCSIHESRSLHQ